MTEKAIMIDEAAFEEAIKETLNEVIEICDNPPLTLMAYSALHLLKLRLFRKEEES